MISRACLSKVFLVTGASRGLGAAIVSHLSELGCKVLASARDEESLSKLWDKVPNVKWVTADLGVCSQAIDLIEHTLTTFGRLDGIVNNAGVIDPILPLSECDPKAWADAIQVNLTAPALLMATALPHLQKSKGRVVNISSGAAVKVVQGWSAYCSSKAGLLHLTKVAAQENPEVGFFSLRPGVIDTQMQNEIRKSQGMLKSDLEKFQQLKQDQKLEPPSVPARSVVWLLLHGPLERSGEFIEYTDEGIQTGISELFSTTETR